MTCSTGRRKVDARMENAWEFTNLEKHGGRD